MLPPLFGERPVCPYKWMLKLSPVKMTLRTLSGSPASAMMTSFRGGIGIFAVLDRMRQVFTVHINFIRTEHFIKRPGSVKGCTLGVVIHDTKAASFKFISEENLDLLRPAMCISLQTLHPKMQQCISRIGKESGMRYILTKSLLFCLGLETLSLEQVLQAGEGTVTKLTVRLKDTRCRFLGCSEDPSVGVALSDLLPLLFRAEGGLRLDP